ncbi:MAG: hypothetical protein M3Z54_06510 [Gemmatimonadota bacterium]|nr:hypothetical protein [Gemmatimonadota bacterium]
MKRADARAAYDDYSRSTSDKVRQLAFAAIGVVWVFRPDTSIQLPRTLLWAATFAVGALALDVLQSLYGTIAWGVFHRRKEHEGLSHDTEFKAPREINWPTNSLFVGKVVALGVCYVFLFHHLFAMLW